MFDLQITGPSFSPQCPHFFLRCPHFFKSPGTLSPVMKFLGRTLLAKSESYWHFPVGLLKLLPQKHDITVSNIMVMCSTSCRSNFCSLTGKHKRLYVVWGRKSISSHPFLAFCFPEAFLLICIIITFSF